VTLLVGEEEIFALAIVEGSSRSLRKSVVPSTGLGTSRVSPAKPRGTLVGLLKAPSAEKESSRKRLEPVSMQVLECVIVVVVIGADGGVVGA